MIDASIFILANSIAKEFNCNSLMGYSLDLFCLGTIADMASLLGANRYWIKKWISNINDTRCLGLREMIKITKSC